MIYYNNSYIRYAQPNHWKNEDDGFAKQKVYNYSTQTFLYYNIDK